MFPAPTPETLSPGNGFRRPRSGVEVQFLPYGPRHVVERGFPGGVQFLAEAARIGMPDAGPGAEQDIHAAGAENERRHAERGGEVTETETTELDSHA